ncbi:MAG TPA: MarR family transcriptional regulator [Candidatus Faecalicoccus intestinipullorum]|nr:MarR family transcriptional regulator [Candidatus Faecalicoccus intestinipullorum]
MSKERTIELINESMLTLMEFTRKNRGPIKGFRSRDLSILIYILMQEKKEPVTMSHLAQNLRVTPAAASQIISGYEKNGWVKRIRSNEDRRTVTIQVTDTIREKILSKWKEHQEALSCFLDELGEEDCENLYRILNKIIDFSRKNHVVDPIE